MTSYWACAQTHPRQEPLALRNLRRQQFHAFFPFFLVESRRRRRRLVQALFPSYVFIELNETSNWSPINSTLGVRRLLTMPSHRERYLRPVPVPFIENLRRLRIVCNGVGPPDDISTEPDLIPIGTRVKISHGAFAEHHAVVAMASPDRVQLLLSVFNRDLVIEFDLDAVEVTATGV